eukprot:10505-Chlamydomonas_euryale.AAC.1
MSCAALRTSAFPGAAPARAAPCCMQVQHVRVAPLPHPLGIAANRRTPWASLPTAAPPQHRCQPPSGSPLAGGVHLLAGSSYVFFRRHGRCLMPHEMDARPSAVCVWHRAMSSDHWLHPPQRAHTRASQLPTPSCRTSMRFHPAPHKKRPAGVAAADAGRGARAAGSGRARRGGDAARQPGRPRERGPGDVWRAGGRAAVQRQPAVGAAAGGEPAGARRAQRRAAAVRGGGGA